MAIEEIEISELEFTEELVSDNLIPVESATDTKATSLQKIKDWLGSFFISKTGNEEFSGTKTMLNQRLRFGKTNLGGFKEIEAVSENEDIRLGVLRFTNGADGVLREAKLGIVDNTNAIRGGLSVRVSSTGVPEAKTIIPSSNSNSDDIATTSWVRKLADNKDIANRVIYAGGGIIQWGTFNASSGYSTILFNTPFTKTGYALSLLNVGPSTTGSVSYKVHTRTTTQAEIVSSSAGDTVWIAIGE